MADEVRVDPAVLRSAASRCRDLHGGLNASLSDVEPETVAADSGLPGWQTRQALRDLLWWWRDDLKKLGARLESVAGALDRSALDYEHTDHTNAAYFREAVLPWR